MWQRRTVLVLFACLAGLGALLFLFGHPSEPRYQNRPLSYWVAMLAGPQARRPEAKEAPAAVTTIGTNALPFLLDWIQYEPPPWNAKLILELLPIHAPWLCDSPQKSLTIIRRWAAIPCALQGRARLTHRPTAAGLCCPRRLVAYTGPLEFATDGARPHSLE